MRTSTSTPPTRGDGVWNEVDGCVDGPAPGKTGPWGSGGDGSGTFLTKWPRSDFQQAQPGGAGRLARLELVEQIQVIHQLVVDEAAFALRR